MTILATPQQQAQWQSQWSQQQQMQWLSQQRIAETAGCPDYQTYLQKMGIGQRTGEKGGSGNGKGGKSITPVALYPALGKGVGKGKDQGKGSTSTSQEQPVASSWLSNIPLDSGEWDTMSNSLAEEVASRS